VSPVGPRPTRPGARGTAQPYPRHKSTWSRTLAIHRAGSRRTRTSRPRRAPSRARPPTSCADCRAMLRSSRAAASWSSISCGVARRSAWPISSSEKRAIRSHPEHPQRGVEGGFQLGGAVLVAGPEVVANGRLDGAAVGTGGDGGRRDKGRGNAASKMDDRVAPPVRVQPDPRASSGWRVKFLAGAPSVRPRWYLF
jgi:hypothetical protein